MMRARLDSVVTVVDSDVVYSSVILGKVVFYCRCEAHLFCQHINILNTLFLRS